MGINYKIIQDDKNFIVFSIPKEDFKKITLKNMPKKIKECYKNFNLLYMNVYDDKVRFRGTIFETPKKDSRAFMDLVYQKGNQKFHKVVKLFEGRN